MSETINFDELADIRQANVRAARYHIKRFEENTFNISNEGKSVIGHNPNMGVNVKFGNGIVVLATLPKDDKRCTSGLLNGTVGNRFTSSELEHALQSNDLMAETYDFEFVQEYDGLRYYKLVPKGDTVDQPEADNETEQQPEEEPQTEEPQTSGNISEEVKTAPADEF